jgi:hypothetical protein
MINGKSLIKVLFCIFFKHWASFSMKNLSGLKKNLDRKQIHIFVPEDAVAQKPPRKWPFLQRLPNQSLARYVADQKSCRINSLHGCSSSSLLTCPRTNHSRGCNSWIIFIITSVGKIREKSTPSIKSKSEISYLRSLLTLYLPDSYEEVLVELKEGSYTSEKRKTALSSTFNCSLLTSSEFAWL